MQSTTHLLTGILSFKLIALIFPKMTNFWVILIACIIALISHYLWDAVAPITYHPLKANWKDPFFKWYHIIAVYLASVVILIFFIKDYWHVMIFATLPDLIDWYTLRPIFKKGPIFHPSIDAFRDKFFAWIPNRKEKRSGVIIEFAILAILLTLILLL